MILAAHGQSPENQTDGRLYTPETSKPRSIPSTNAFAIEPPLPADPPIFISPMYTNLWANTPRDVMTFSEKTFPEGTTAFPFRYQILKYLQEYGEDIRHLVEFNREILRIEKEDDNWQLTVRDLLNNSKETWTEEFDAVAVASGRISSVLAYRRSL